jgi:hypothetical protein
MDLLKAIRELRLQKEKLDNAIARLEAMAGRDTITPKKKPGRKSMSAEERQAVSERMRRYWANRRSGS